MIEDEDKTNKKYKDSVFVDLFYEDEKAKENELSLYNALFDTDYTLDEVVIEKIKVDNVIYMKLKNDVSFNVNHKLLVFSEHQSTINGNMPLRDLLYVSRVYEKMIPVEDRYKSRTVKLPRPEFFVFYNGVQKDRTDYVQKLSDAYIDSADSDNISLELTVRVININTYAGNKLLERCHVMKEYSQFVEKVREYRDYGIDEYMKQAIEYCIKQGILEEYLRRKGSEVMGFLCAEYDYEMDMKVKGEEWYEEGFEDGRREGYGAGRKDGYGAGRKDGYGAGRKDGYGAGRKDGYGDGHKDGLLEGIKAFIFFCLEENKPKEVIISQLTKTFHLSGGQAEEYYNTFSTTQ